ncbi:contact-dependent growth inhibition system immunity protein [Streptomyces cirratus]|uniref:contact-dependent growth inhibition system immunity protein n=1 Tax=Streptomyces cirratus TaxID=68187 RepID=UPI00361CD5B1
MNATELARLIGQDVGIPWLLPLSLNLLAETAPHQAAGGFYDDDLLSAVLTRAPATWAAHPELVREVEHVLSSLGEISSYIQDDVNTFLRAKRGR